MSYMSWAPGHNFFLFTQPVGAVNWGGLGRSIRALYLHCHDINPVHACNMLHTVLSSSWPTTSATGVSFTCVWSGSPLTTLLSSHNPLLLTHIATQFHHSLLLPLYWTMLLILFFFSLLQGMLTTHSKAFQSCPVPLFVSNSLVQELTRFLVFYIHNYIYT